VVELRNLIADVEDDHFRVIQRFKKSNQSLDDENNVLRTKVASLNSAIDSKREEVAKLQHALSSAEEEHVLVIQRFKKSNQSLDDENNNLRTKIAALNFRIDRDRG